METVEYLTELGLVLGEPVPVALLKSGRIVEVESPISPEVVDNSLWYLLDGHFDFFVDGDDLEVVSVESDREFVVRGQQVISMSYAEFDEVFPEIGRLELQVENIEMYWYDLDPKFSWTVTFTAGRVTSFGTIAIRE